MLESVSIFHHNDAIASVNVLTSDTSTNERYRLFFMSSKSAFIENQRLSMTKRVEESVEMKLNERASSRCILVRHQSKL
jgi:hypothetical protein